MSKTTESILRAVSDELNARRDEIDNDDTIGSITLVVRLDYRTRRPSEVLYRPDHRRRLTSVGLLP